LLLFFTSIYKKIAGCLKALSLQSRDERLSRATLVAYRLSHNDFP
jgi:hypothetical protein